MAAQPQSGVEPSPPDHRGAVLRGQDFAGRDLRGADLRDADLKDADFRGARLEGAKLQGASLVGTRLEGADLRGAQLDGAQLDGAVLDAVLLDGARARDTTWARVRARGGSWVGLDLEGASGIALQLTDVDLRSARLLGVRLADSVLQGVRLDGASGAGFVLQNSRAQGLSAVGADLPGWWLRANTIDTLDLRELRCAGAQVTGNALSGVRLDGIRAEGARFDGNTGLGQAEIDALRRGGASVPRSLPRALVDLVAMVPWGRLGPAAVATVVIASSIYAVGQQLLRTRSVDPTEAPDPVGEETPDPADQERLLVLEGRLSGPMEGRVALLVELSRVLERLGRVRDAEDRLLEAVELQHQLQAQEQLLAGPQGAPAEVHPEDDPDLDLWRFYVRRGLLHDAIALAQERQRDARNLWEEVHARFLVARTHLAGKDLDACRNEIGQIAGRLPALVAGRAEFHLELVRVHDEMGELPRALALLLELPEDTGDEDRAEAELLRASLLARTGDLAGAVTILDEVQQRWPDLPPIVARARAERAKVLDGPGAAPAVLSGLEAAATAEDPATARQGALALARFHRQNGDPGRAILVLEAALVHLRGAPEARVDVALALADLRWTRKEHDEAFRVLREEEDGLSAAAAGPLRLHLALRFAELARFDDAERALDGVPRGADGQESLAVGMARARIALSRGRTEDARFGFERVAEGSATEEAPAEARLELARILLDLGRFADARAHLDTLAAALPAPHRIQGEVAIERARLLERTARADPAGLESLLAAARAAALPDSQPGAYGELMLRLARSFARERRFEDARATAAKVRTSAAARMDPQLNQSAVQVEVDALVALGQRQAAERLIQEAPMGDLSSASDQEACAARVARARSELRAGDLRSAKASWQELFALCPSPRFAVHELPLAADALVEAGGAREARELLVEVRGAARDPLVLQAVCLERVRLGDWVDLDCAETGPDEGLGDLARLEHGSMLSTAGRLAEAEPLWSAVARRDEAEPCVRARALLGLASLDLARALGESAAERIDLARRDCADDAVRTEAIAMLSRMRQGGIESPRPQVAFDPRAPEGAGPGGPGGPEDGAPGGSGRGPGGPGGPPAQPSGPGGPVPAPGASGR